ncbi:MAG: hypothetical protein M1825_000197 [Sarcosagium campestre]|nr:MAG: hypothetical protein M1825_000197 [Sarcosagium campestre]
MFLTRPLILPATLFVFFNVSNLAYGAPSAVSPVDTSNEGYIPNGSDDVGALSGPRQSQNAPPEVDLGYAKHVASTENTAEYFNFSNIRYAAAPTGPRRFRAPVEPESTGNKSDGSTGSSCIQHVSDIWASGVAALGDDAKFIGLPPVTRPQSEDCLFLDVITPRRAFFARDSLPVLVWIHGGAYNFGDKSTGYNPAGLLRRGGQNFLFVAMNYRLGAFGFLAGEDADANAGLLDQRLALKWVQKHISKFGGDPKRVTIYGESAGAGSVFHHISAYGGSNKAEASLFQGAIAQSLFQYTVPPSLQKPALDAYLKALKVSSIDEARALPADSDALITANTLAGEGFGPIIEADENGATLIPDVPYKLYNDGRFNKNVKLMIGSVGDEARVFTPTTLKTDSDYDALLKARLPGAPQALLDQISKLVYPPPGSAGAGPYNSTLERAKLTIAESQSLCTAAFLANAFENQTFNYLFDLPPAIHTQDLLYSFNNDPSPVVDSQIARIYQGYIANFVIGGDPNGSPSNTLTTKDLPVFGTYGSGNSVLTLKKGGVSSNKDIAINDRCLFWNAVGSSPVS